MQSTKVVKAGLELSFLYVGEALCLSIRGLRERDLQFKKNHGVAQPPPFANLPTWTYMDRGRGRVALGA